ncbi:MAG: amidohydrolase [Pseudomonadales bacterium]
MDNNYFALFISVLLLTSCAAQMPNNSQQPADHVFLNGTVYTVDGERSIAEAIATGDDKIVFVGASAQAKKLIGANTRVHDLQGRLLLPGLHDSHVHPTGIVEPDFCDFKSAVMTLDEIAAFVRDCIAKYDVPAGEWVAIPQWNFAAGNQPSDKFLTLRAALDAASDQHPILLRGNDGHHGAVNSLALANARNAQGKRVGISKSTLASTFAEYKPLVGLDKSGEPSGGLTEAAIPLTGAPNFFDLPADPDAIIAKIPPVLAAAGITTIQDAAAEPTLMDNFKQLEDDGTISFRYYAALIKGFDTDKSARPGMKDIPNLIAEFSRIKSDYATTKYIRAHAAKIFVDGVIEGNPLDTPPTLPNAAILNDYLQPIFELDSKGNPQLTGYADVDGEACQPVNAKPQDYTSDAAVARFKSTHSFHPRQCTKSNGVLEQETDFLFAYMQALDKSGFTIHAHAIGDRAVRLAIDGMSRARDANGDSKLPHNIAHAQLIHSADRKRIGDMGLFVTFTHAWSRPEFAYEMTVAPFVDRLSVGATDMYNPENYYMQNVYPARSIQELGGIVTAGSDAPVDARDPRPFFNMEQAVTRANDDNNDGVVLNTEERLSIQDIIAAYTINGARAVDHDADVGSLEVGKRADLIVLEQNIIELAETGQANKISDTQVSLTLFDGKVVYENN